MADDWVLDETGLPAIGGNHHSLGRLGLDGQGSLAVGLDQGMDWEGLGLHGDPLGVHLHQRKFIVSCSPAETISLPLLA